VPPPTPGFGTTPYGTPEYGTPQQGQPPYGQPPQGQPQYAPPQYGPPQYGQPPFDQPQYGQPSYGPQHAPYGYPSAAAERRPVTVTIAAALTWVFAGITLLGYTLIILALVAAQDQLIDALQSEPQFQELGLPTRDFLAVLWTMCAVVMVWCVAALVLAVLAFRRSNWARIVLAVSGRFACLAAAVGAGERAAQERLVSTQACRSTARSRRTPSSSTSCSLQNAHRTRWRPSSTSS
jgi:hypothetical protein